jgi:ApaG protein
MSDAVTRGIRIRVRSQFVPEHSEPENDRYHFAYHVTITNEGSRAAQLLARHWIITDGAGLVREVKGPGVVGQQPRLDPGEAFEYTSACPLTTPVGSMYGTYHMVTDAGDTFEARIAPFTLALPTALN